MFIKRLIAASGLAAVALCCHAQDSLLLRDYRFVKRSDPWLTSSNAAALTRFAADNIAEAGLSVTKGRGGHTDFWQSPDCVQADAEAESFCRINSRTVVFGGVEYENFAGKEMAGSAFINPSHQPFDIVEDSLTNTGKKHRDTYTLAGGVGIDVWRGVAVGLRLDYTAANYAKYKDLRHKNKLMDMNLSAGVSVPIGRWGRVGLNYIYHRNTESIVFSTYGKSDRVYNSLISYAAFMGHVEQFGTGGYTDKSREMPLVNDCNGLGVQLGADVSGLSVYTALDYTHRTGYYGRRSPYTITHSHHHGDTYRWVSRLAFTPVDGHRVSADLTIDAENLQNEATTRRELQNEAGATYYSYYARVKTADKLWVDGTASLTADLGIVGELPAWTVTAGMSWTHRKQTGYMYPYYRRQRLTGREPFVRIVRNVVTSRGVWSVEAGGSFRKGSGQPCTDQTFAEPSDKQEAPPTMDAYMWREYQWLTAAQYSIDGAVRYSFVAAGMKPHVRLGIGHRKSNETNQYSAGRDHTRVEVALGCTF